MVELIDSKSGLKTLKFKNKYIHSKYDPKKEAEIFIKNNRSIFEKETVVVIGLGLGYHIEEIISCYRNVNKIYVFEYSSDVIDLCYNENNLIFKNEKIEIIGPKDNFYKDLNEKLYKVKDVLIHKPSLEYLKEINENLYNVLVKFQQSKESVLLNREMLLENKKINQTIESKSINDIIDKKAFKDKPALILSAGPSLDLDIDKIKENREAFNIIAVGSVLQRVIQKGIYPDYVVIIDGNDIVYKQFKGLEDLSVPLCFLDTASSLTVKNYNGPKYIFYNDKEDKYDIKTGKTVAVAAISLAIQFGAKEVVLLGQDLTSIGGKTHIESYCDMYHITGEENFTDKVLAKDINGENVVTARTYLYFKSNIEEIIMENKQIKFFNCSKGLYINGCNHINFEKYLGRGKK